MIREKLLAMLDSLRQPSGFPDDWYAEVTSQAGHAAIIGVALGLLAILFLPPVWAPPAAFIVYLLIWEFSVQASAPGGDWRDSLKDAVNVMCGAGLVAVGAMMAADFWFFWRSFAAAWAAWMLGNLITTWRRLP